jgi:hypothetical protein
MVGHDGGQLYTIEGLAAALIMVITAYMVVSATSVYTAGDTHISDMQLETMGSDALAVMGTPVNITENDVDGGNSTLRSILEDAYPTAEARNESFRTKFLELVNGDATGPKREVQFVANYTCRDFSGSPLSFTLSNSTRGLTGTEHPVRVTKWVITRQQCPIGSGALRDRAVLVEVLLWLD